MKPRSGCPAEFGIKNFIFRVIDPSPRNLQIRTLRYAGVLR